MNKKVKIRVDVISDIVCPWCYIGKRRLEKAIKYTQSSDNVQVDDIEIVYHPFQLDPSVPSSEQDFHVYMEKRFGGDFTDKFRQVEQAAETEGLAFDFANLPKAINTFTLHRILTIAEQDGIQAEVKEAFMKAYFVDKIDLTLDENIVSIMANYGWDEAKTKGIIHSDVASDEVKEEMNYYRQLGISGVPFFIFNQKYAVSGAQPSDVFVEVLEKVAQELEVTNVEGEVCDIDGENC